MDDSNEISSTKSVRSGKTISIFQPCEMGTSQHDSYKFRMQLYPNYVEIKASESVSRVNKSANSFVQQPLCDRSHCFLRKYFLQNKQLEMSFLTQYISVILSNSSVSVCLIFACAFHTPVRFGVHYFTSDQSLVPNSTVYSGSSTAHLLLFALVTTLLTLAKIAQLDFAYMMV